MVIFSMPDQPAEKLSADILNPVMEFVTSLFSMPDQPAEKLSKIFMTNLVGRHVESCRRTLLCSKRDPLSFEV